MLKSIPYGPAGTDLIPKGVRRMIQANDRSVETIDETSKKDYMLISTRRALHRARLTEYFRGPNDLVQVSLLLEKARPILNRDVPLDMYADVIQ